MQQFAGLLPARKFLDEIPKQNPETMNTCQLNPEEAVPCLDQGRPASAHELGKGSLALRSTLKRGVYRWAPDLMPMAAWKSLHAAAIIEFTTIGRKLRERA